jgi:hypothetical protein
MIYNTGTRTRTEVGFGRQIHRKLWDEEKPDKKLTDYVDVNSPKIVRSGDVIVNNQKPLNAHHTLEEIIPYIGKLTFCQPHIHSINKDLGVNIRVVTKNNPTTYDFYLSIIQDYSSETLLHDYEYSWGSLGSGDLYDYPHFNLSINTKDSILY